MKRARCCCGVTTDTDAAGLKTGRAEQQQELVGIIWRVERRLRCCFQSFECAQLRRPRNCRFVLGIHL